MSRGRFMATSIRFVCDAELASDLSCVCLRAIPPLATNENTARMIERC